MPRIRTIKPEFWDSPGTARASLRARLFFIAMWNWADDYGIGTANAKQLIGFAFPNDDDVTVADFPRLRTEVSECYGVVFYVVGGRRYYAIPSWDRHQKNERRAMGRNPSPGEADSVPDKEERGDAEMRGSSVRSHGRSGTGTGEQGNRGTEKNTRSSAIAESMSDDGFAAWWSAYPRKVGKGQAGKAYRGALKKTKATALLAALQAQTPTLMAKGAEFCPYPATWLNGERWADETVTDATPKPLSRIYSGDLREYEGDPDDIDAYQQHIRDEHARIRRERGEAS
jgi:hypothetical protein